MAILLRRTLVALFFCVLALASLAPITRADEREWTFLVFLNGNNNLDQYGTMDINEMETVGSTPGVAVVVQWASYDRGRVQRLLVQKDSDKNKVTSPVVEDIGDADMGDSRTLVDFVRWGMQKYPAKHYFVNVWNHGSGWHLKQAGLRPSDISWDDRSGHHITTEQLGQAMKEISTTLGRKLDLYGSDACLMAMAEVADEMADSVASFVGSEETEPLEGWPYDALLSQWNRNPSMSPNDVAKALVNVYVKSYQGGTQGNQEVTLSAYDLSQLGAFNESVAALGRHLKTLVPASKDKIIQAADASQSFTESDYRDTIDFLDQLERLRLSGLDRSVLSGVRDATKNLVVANSGTPQYAKAHGIAMWLPNSKWSYSSYSARYASLKFNAHTAWGDIMADLYK